MAKKDDKDIKRFDLLGLELDSAQYEEVEKEKVVIIDELDRSKKYLIEEVLEDGETLLKEIDRKEKKSLWDRIMDFIFK